MARPTPTPTHELREARVIYLKTMIAYKKNRGRFNRRVLLATFLRGLIKLAVLLLLMALLPWAVPKLLGAIKQFTEFELPYSVATKLNSFLHTCSELIHSPEKFELTYLIAAGLCAFSLLAALSYRKTRKRVWNTQWSRHFSEFSTLRKALLAKLNTAFHTDWRIVYSNIASPYGIPLPGDIVTLNRFKQKDTGQLTLDKPYKTLTRYERPIAKLEGVFLFSKESTLLLSFEGEQAIYGKLGCEAREIDLRDQPDERQASGF